MNRLYFLLLFFLLQSCIASYTNRHVYSMNEPYSESGGKPITAYFYLTKRTFDFPLPLVVYFGDKGAYSLSFSLSDPERRYSDFIAENLQIYADEKFVYASSDSSIFRRDIAYIEGKEVYTFYYKTQYNIKIPKKALEVRLDLIYKLVHHNGEADYFKVDKVFEVGHKKGFGPFL